MRYLILSVSALALAACGAPSESSSQSSANAQEPAPEVTTTDLGNGLYMIEGQGGNVGLSIGDDATIVIDDQYERMFEAIQGAIADLTDDDVDYVINTHWHGDHTGGNAAMAETGAIIIAHDNIYTRMSQDNYNELWDRTTPPSPEIARPKLTFSDNITMRMNGEVVKVMHMPGAHTDGDAVIFFDGANVVHMGDNLFNQRFPFIDVSSGGSIDGMINVHETVLGMIDADTRIIPGHGPLASRADLESHLAMLQDAKARVQAHIDQGDDMETTIAAAPLSGYAEDWDWGFINQDTMTTLVYMSLTK